MNPKDIVKSNDTGVLGIVLKGFGKYGKNNRFLPIGCDHYTMSDLQIVTEESFSATSIEEKVSYLKATFADGKVNNSLVMKDGKWVILEAELGTNGKSMTRFFIYLNFKSTDKSYLSKDSAFNSIQEHEAKESNKVIVRKRLEELEVRQSELQNKLHEMVAK